MITLTYDTSLLVHVKTNASSIMPKLLTYFIRGSRGSFVKYGTDQQISQVRTRGMTPGDEGGTRGYGGTADHDHAETGRTGGTVRALGRGCTEREGELGRVLGGSGEDDQGRGTARDRSEAVEGWDKGDRARVGERAGVAYHTVLVISMQRKPP